MKIRIKREVRRRKI